jgi:SAM-dependent methyltransferase
MGTRPEDSKSMMDGSKYRGVAQIVAYNRTFYAASALAICASAIAMLWTPPMARIAIAVFLAAAFYWMVASLLASHWIYDRSSLYSLDWLTVRPAYWLSIHAGLDEMSSLIRSKFPECEYRVLDVFDPKEMTEPSIARAREMSGPDRLQAVSWRRLPAGEAVFDTIFLIFMAHEFRRAEARLVFFGEVARVLAPHGCVVFLEHLRDLPNFLAFGPGFFHFQSRQTWLSTLHAAGFEIVRESKITPFIRVFEVTR